ncbi:unnamed protein product [Paramecium primaurelia]|uniref:Uncharacterized protein n=1 Tax=Paramecium primaurelia TaxID=5886 RepID=A0A8S1K0N3_PARPR|nr:unnamed protein product [Paramecium primaurelia]
MSLDRMRKSFQIIFGIDNCKATREPIIQERIKQEFVFDSKLNEQQHQNKFSMMNQQRKRSNQYYYVLDRLRSFQQNKTQSNEYEKIPVITYLKDNIEKKVNLNINHARWNYQDRFPENDSSNISSSFGEKLVQKSSNIIASVSKQDFRPYYAQEHIQDNMYIQSQSQQYNQDKILQSKKLQTIFGGNRSKVNFLREDKEQRSKSHKSDSNFKKLGGILEDDFIIPSFLKDESIHDKIVQDNIHDKNIRGKEVQINNNKFLEIQSYNFSTFNKENNPKDFQLELNGSFQQIGFNKINSQINTDDLIEKDQPSQKPITHKKLNQIKYCYEKNPFLISNDDNSQFECRFKSPQQNSNLIKDIYNEYESNEIFGNLQFDNNSKQLDNQKKKSSDSIEQQGNISFGNYDMNPSDDQQLNKIEKDQYIEGQNLKNSFIFDNFVNPKFDFENHTPLSKDQSINKQKQLDFSEQTPQLNFLLKQNQQNLRRIKNKSYIKKQNKCQRINLKKPCI